MYCIHDELEPGVYLAHGDNDEWRIVLDLSPFALVSFRGFTSEADARQHHAEMKADFDLTMSRAAAPLN